MNAPTPLIWPATVDRHPAHESARQLAARLLRRASNSLEHLAGQLAAPRSPRVAVPAMLEFHAEAGAPEGGALYMDGRLVGWLPGVDRL